MATFRNKWGLELVDEELLANEEPESSDKSALFLISTATYVVGDVVSSTLDKPCNKSQIHPPLSPLKAPRPTTRITIGGGINTYIPSSGATFLKGLSNVTGKGVPVLQLGLTAQNIIEQQAITTSDVVNGGLAVWGTAAALSLADSGPVVVAGGVYLLA